MENATGVQRGMIYSEFLRFVFDGSGLRELVRRFVTFSLVELISVAFEQIILYY